MQKQPANKAISTSYIYGSFNTHKWDLSGNYRNTKFGFTVQGSVFFNHSDNNYKVWGDPIKITDSQTGRIQYINTERFHEAYQSKGITLNTGFTKVKWADRFLLGFIYSDMKKDIQRGATMKVVYGNRKSMQETFMGKMQYEKKDLFPNLDVSVNMTYSSGERMVIDTIPYMYTWEGEIMLDRNGNPVVWEKRGGEAGNATLATNMEKTLTARTRVSYEFFPKHTLTANFLVNKFTRDVKDPYLTEAQQRFTDTRHLSRLKDMIQKSLTNLTDEMYGYENLGKIRSKGVDFDLRYNYNDQVMSEFKMSYTDARFNLRFDMHSTENPPKY